MLGGTLLVDGTQPIRGCAVDSRRAAAGQLFLALPGEQTHGLRHANEALRAGATAIVVEVGESTAEIRQTLTEVELAVRASGASLIRVENGRVALSRVAAEWRNRFTSLARWGRPLRSS
jgi:UDP-N-acetylmuramoyl-L-alanyl-D-glutamate--2,6-diaminopimelate ligase